MALTGIVGPEVKRNEPQTNSVPSSGLIVLRDGDSGEPEILMSPVTYIFSHEAELSVRSQSAAALDRDDQVDALLRSIEATIATDFTLGGKVDRVSIGSSEFVVEAVESASPIKTARVPVVLEYSSTSVLS